MMRWLNSRGIRPYLTASGIVPDWMLAPDGKTLVDYDAFAVMMVTMLEWAKKKKTSILPSSAHSTRPTSALPKAQRSIRPVMSARAKPSTPNLRRGLGDIRFVVAEQAHFNADYLTALTAAPQLHKRIAIFALHDYVDIPQSRYADVTAVVRTAPMQPARSG